MSTQLPVFRSEISIDVHQENNEHYLVLHDPFGIAEGPIMVHADMIEVLELCNGVTTWADVAIANDVTEDSEEIQRIQSFVAQLDSMGYFETAQASKLENTVVSSWADLTVRPAVCSGSTYPDDAAALTATLQSLCSLPASTEHNLPALQPTMILMPHIDFRVAGKSYATAAHYLRECTAELIVMIGTSHYWSNDTIILTEKHYSSPLGMLETNGHMVRQLQHLLLDRGLSVSSSDLAHKPEHSLELHAVVLQHVLPSAGVEVLPILVGGSGSIDMSTMARIAESVQTVVEGSGKRTCWLVSGDMSHYGRRFGDEQDASQLHDPVTAVDHQILEFLQQADAENFHTALATTGNRTNVCGYGPLLLAMLAAKPQHGAILSYERWDDDATGSAVTFASVGWQ